MTGWSPTLARVVEIFEDSEKVWIWAKWGVKPIQDNFEDLETAPRIIPRIWKLLVG